MGIIDILQSYRFRKKLEHTFKAILWDGDTVSVHRPGFYAHRFLDFMADKVFKKIQSRKFYMSAFVRTIRVYNRARIYLSGSKGVRETSSMCLYYLPDYASNCLRSIDVAAFFSSLRVDVEKKTV